MLVLVAERKKSVSSLYIFFCSLTQKAQHTRLHRITENFVHRLDVLFLRRVQNNDDGADEAQGTSNLAHSSQLLMKEKRCEDGTILFPVVDIVVSDVKVSDG